MYINARPFLHTPHAETRRYQMELLGVLMDIDRVSQEFGISYSVEAGTALGAVRHGGFIPWDNDADILMPVAQVKEFVISMAKMGLFEKYDIWYYDKGWGWLIKDIYLPGILRNPSSFCETSLDWVIGKMAFAVFRIVRKEPTTIQMSLSKDPESYQVAHFDPTLSTISLAFKFMTPEEKKTWRRRYLLESEQYKVHPFVDVFPSLEMTPEAYIKMKKGFRTHDRMTAFAGALAKPGLAMSKAFRRFLPDNHIKVAASHGGGALYEDYRVGVQNDYDRGVERAKLAEQNGDKLVLSKTPWNLRKIIPYLHSHVYPLARIPFEHTELNAPGDVVALLENHYRDFRTPPPEGERIQHAYHLDPNQFEQIVRVNV